LLLPLVGLHFSLCAVDADSGVVAAKAFRQLARDAKWALSPHAEALAREAEGDLSSERDRCDGLVVLQSAISTQSRRQELQMAIALMREELMGVEERALMTSSINEARERQQLDARRLDQHACAHHGASPSPQRPADRVRSLGIASRSADRSPRGGR
jgi:hypothetical protein